MNTKRVPLEFVERIRWEMPKNTIIGDPDWWAERLYRWALNAAPSPVEPDSAASAFWFCWKCNEEVQPTKVTYEENHEACGCPVEWIVPETANATLNSKLAKLVVELAEAVSKDTEIIKAALLKINERLTALEQNSHKPVVIEDVVDRRLNDWLSKVKRELSQEQGHE